MINEKIYFVRLFFKTRDKHFVNLYKKKKRKKIDALKAFND